LGMSIASIGTGLGFSGASIVQSQIGASTAELGEISSFPCELK
jgi:hypothetical protein